MMVNAKRSFVLANKLTSGPLHSLKAFLDSFEALSLEVDALSDSAIDWIVGADPSRLERYNRAQWTLGPVDLRACRVWSWPHMGEHQWAEGGVFQVAEMFKKYDPNHRVCLRMKEFAEANVFSSKLPIIVLVCSAQWQIDDGSHRAVAMALAGITFPSAWIGTYD